MRGEMEKFIRLKNNVGAVVNSDKEALEAYKLRKKKNSALENEINSLKSRLENLEKLLEKKYGNISS